MSLPHIVMWLVVVVVGILSWRNPTTAALVLAYVFVEGLAFLGWQLPLEYYAYPDIVVLAIIFAKPEYCDEGMYRSTWHQLKCLLIERSPADRCVMLIFPLMWATYVADLSDFSKWWILWGLGILQFLFASTESIETFMSSRTERERPSPSDDVSRFSWATGYG